MPCFPARNLCTVLVQACIVFGELTLCMPVTILCITGPRTFPSCFQRFKQSSDSPALLVLAWLALGLIIFS